MHLLIALLFFKPVPQPRTAPSAPSVVCAVLDFPATGNSCSSNFMMTASPASGSPQTYFVSQNPGFPGTPFFINLNGAGAMNQLGVKQ